MTIRPFGQTRSGISVEAIRLVAGEISATILTFGATVQDLRLAGTPWPLTLGCDRVEAYEGACRWLGTICGPVANRIRAAQAVIAGKTYRFEANEAGRTCLHSGLTGADQQVWQIAEAGADHCTLTLTLADGLGGFPGNRQLAAGFALRAPGVMSLTLTAISDATSLMNLLNHSYWNLDGTATTAGHRLQILADRYLPDDADNLPMAPQPVAGTRFDLRTGRALAANERLDHNFCLAEAPREVTEVARLTGAKGVEMRLLTDAPGVQAYDGAGLKGQPYLGHMGQPYGPRAGLALEPQFWPDAPGRAGFPSILLEPGQLWQQRSEWHFSRGQIG